MHILDTMCIYIFLIICIYFDRPKTLILFVWNSRLIKNVNTFLLTEYTIS